MRDKVPPEVFTTPITIRSAATRRTCATTCARRTRLLKEAGFEVKDRKLVDPQGKPVSVEFLMQDPAYERIALFYKPSLERLGIAVSVRVRSTTCSIRTALRSFDFDIITIVWGQSLSPGNEQRDFWGSQAADQPGSRNTLGIKNPAIDALIERVIFAKDRADLVAATQGARSRAAVEFLRRAAVHLSASQRYARWDRFSHRRAAAEIWRVRLADAVVVGRRQGGQDRQSALERSSRMPSLVAPARARSGRRCAQRALAALRAGVGRAGTEAHGMSAFGDLKYPADFQHFDYVNPAAPKGGTFSLIPSVRAYNQSFFTFNSLNAFILKGEGAQGMDMTFVPLMARANDEPDAMYGLAAKSVQISADKTDLPLHDAARGALSRRLEADRA